MSYKEDMREIIIILDEIIKVLESVNKDFSFQQYIDQYKYFRNNCGCAESEGEANDTRREILHTYSQGMASFNDLALWVDGKPLPEDLKFDELKDKLFETLKDQL